MSTPQPVPFISKHAFQGDVRQSQLSFGPGMTILAKPGQDGAWWWGSANGKEGWFPPAYVTPAPAGQGMQFQQPPPPAAAFLGQQQPSMQQRMQNVSFAAAAPQQRGPPQGAFAPPQAQGYGAPPGSGYGVPPAAAFAGPPQSAFGAGPPSVARPQPVYEPEDPFAGLQSNGASNIGVANGSMMSPNASTSPSNMQTQKPPIPVNPVLPKPAVPAVNTKTDSTAAAMARLGISSRSPTPISGSGGISPASNSRTASPSPNNRGASFSPPPPAAAFNQSATMSQEALVAQQQAAIQSAAPSMPVAPRRETAEEGIARRAREQEEARLKEQMRREKEEIRVRLDQEAAGGAVSGGIGSSGVSLAITEGQTSGFVSSMVFNPYDFLMGTTGQLPERTYSPIFRVPPYWALMNLNTYINQKPVPREKLNDRSAMYAQLSNALSFLCYVCAETEKEAKKGMGRRGATRKESSLEFLRGNHYACEACIKLISLLPHSAGASGQQLDGLFINFLNVFISLVEQLQPNQQLVIPGGWQQPEYTYLCLYILRRGTNNRWSFTVCNTGNDGIQYHPSTFDPETGREQKQLAMTVWDISIDRVVDSTFWTLLFRMQVYPSRKNNAAFLYTKLMPALNSRPLLSNLDQGPAEYVEVPDPISVQSFHPLARLALTTTPATGFRSSKYTSLLVMNAAADLAYSEIEKFGPSSMDPEDSRILKMTGRNLSNFASSINPNTIGDGSLGASLSDTWDLLDKLLKKINYSSSKAMDQYSHGLSVSAMNDDFAQGKIVTMKTNAGAAAHPLFGRLRRDNYAEVVKSLMGDPRPDPILIPAVLTDEQLPPVAVDYGTAASYMQRVADACSLLLQQRRLIKNSPAFAASAAQHVFMHVLPMPNHEPKFCFWRKLQMRRETQLNLLFLIRRLCRIYSAATACVQASRGLIAIRSTAFACAACVSDAICRAVAIDDPSTFALHYSGLCEGPTEPFGIEAGAYDTLGSNLPIYDPAICSLRFQCLEYLRGLTFKRDGSKKQTIFNFDKSMSPTESDLVLIDQLSIQLALQRPFPKTEMALMNRAATLIAGANGSIIEVLPEFEYFRDIVFHFKHAVSGKSPTPTDVPDTKTWLASDSTLHWQVKRKDKEDPTLEYAVTAFQGHEQEYVSRVAQQEEKATSSGSSFLGFKLLFAAKTRIERSRLSSADPTTVVNSCGEKFMAKRSKPVSVMTEDDVLHLTNSELPTFGHVLTPSDSERFIQFLTAPYIRIPLILDFFANGDPTRLTALKSKSLQIIVDAALFEPGRWKHGDFSDYINEVPIVDIDRLESILATSHGTLFNEIAKSPDVLTSCVCKMLERALDMDVGRYTRKASSGPLILYMIRLAVRLEGFLKYALKKCVPGQPRPRGLETLDNIKVDAAMKKIRRMLDDQAIPTLEYWIDPSRSKDVDTACITHSHLLYVFKNYDYEDLDYRAVSILMSSQVYLTINHRFSSKVYDDLQDPENPTHPPPSIQIAQSEIFDSSKFLNRFYYFTF